MAEHQALTPNAIGKALVDAGIVPRLCQRIIIDIRHNEMPVLYYQTIADTRLLDIDWASIAPTLIVSEVEPGKGESDAPPVEFNRIHNIAKIARQRDKLVEALEKIRHENEVLQNQITILKGKTNEH